MLPGVFDETIFARKVPLAPSLFMRPMHPKTEIRPTREAIQKVLEAGWVGQLKVHGHRGQIHISSDSEKPIIVYNRQGAVHKKTLSPQMVSELRRVFAPQAVSPEGEIWNVIDTEWIKDDDRLYVFDFLKKDGQALGRLSFLERWKMLPKDYLSPCMQTLSVFGSLEQCLTALEKKDDFIEGLVFKSASPGFEDTSIIRCRKQGATSLS